MHLINCGAGAPVARGSRLELPSPATLLTGPPISMGGMPNSLDNMIEVVLGVMLTAPDGEKNWDAELKLPTVIRESGQDIIPEVRVTSRPRAGECGKVMTIYRYPARGRR